MSDEVTQLKAILADETQFADVCSGAFEAVDTDKSGSINVSELKVCLNEINTAFGCANITEDQATEALKKLDKNNDGVLSKEEFSVLVRQLLEGIIAALESSWLNKTILK